MAKLVIKLLFKEKKRKGTWWCWPLFCVYTSERVVLYPLDVFSILKTALNIIDIKQVKKIATNEKPFSIFKTLTAIRLKTQPVYGVLEYKDILVFSTGLSLKKRKNKLKYKKKKRYLLNAQFFSVWKK